MSNLRDSPQYHRHENFPWAGEPDVKDMITRQLEAVENLFATIPD